MTTELQASATDPAEGLPADPAPETVAAEGASGAPTEESDEEKNRRIQAEAAEESRKRAERRQASIEKRFAELTAEKYEARKQAQALVEQNAKLTAMLEGKQPAQPAASGEPTRDQFESYEDFVTARAEYRAEQRAVKAAQELIERENRSRQELESRRSQETERQQVEREFLTRKAEAVKSFPDFQEVINGWEPNIPEGVAELILRLPDGPLIGYHLAKSPELEARLRDAPAYMQGIVLGEIRTALKSSQATPKESTKAPAPGSPVTPKVSASTTTEYNGDPEGYFAWARKHLK